MSKDTLHICLPYVSSDMLLAPHVFVFHIYHGAFLVALMTYGDFLFLRHSIKEFGEIWITYCRVQIKFSFFNNNHLSLREHVQFWKTLLIGETQHWKEHMVRRMSKHDQDFQKFRNTGEKNYPSNLKLKSCYSFFRNFV